MKGVVWDSHDFTDSALRKRAGGERRGVTDSARGKGVVRDRSVFTDSAGGKFLVGRCVMLHKVQVV